MTSDTSPRVQILKQMGYHFLWIDEELWMWDIPQEVKYQKEMAEKAWGDVLIAGYGLGLVQRFLSQNSRVKSFVTIERSSGVVNEVKKVFGNIYGAVWIDDFFDVRQSFLLGVYDVVIGDIWIDIHPGNLDQYCRFKLRAEELLKDNGVILAWGQDYFEYLLKEQIL